MLPRFHTHSSLPKEVGVRIAGSGRVRTDRKSMLVLADIAKAGSIRAPTLAAVGHVHRTLRRRQSAGSSGMRCDQATQAFTKGTARVGGGL